jgi:hypothetical protein
MKVWTTLSESDLYDIAEEIGVCLADRGSVNANRNPLTRVGRAYSFGLRPDKSTRNGEGDYLYQRVSSNIMFSEGRRVFAVCWHGHRDFMQEVFRRDPDARIKTAMADYRGAADFEAKYHETAYWQVGAPIAPVFAAEVCKCGEGAW